MITIKELHDPKVFSDFVEKMQRGETTIEEEEIFEKALDGMESTLRDVAEKIINSKHNN